PDPPRVPGAAAARPGVPGGAPSSPPIGPLTEALQAALRKGGEPADVARTLMPAVAAIAGMDVASLATPAPDGIGWMAPPADGEPLSDLPQDKLAQAMRGTDPVWIASATPRLGLVGLLPLRIADETLGLLVGGRTQGQSASPEEVTALRLAADVLATALRAATPPPAPVEIVREVVKEVQVPVQVPVEVVKEVVREVPVEVIREVLREVPVEVPVVQ